MTKNFNRVSAIYHADGMITHINPDKKPYSEKAGIKHFKSKTKGYVFTKKITLRCV